MPLYEFLCTCGNRFEKLCKINDKPLSVCPVCGKDARRVVSTFRQGRSSSSGAGTFSSGGGCSGCSSSSCAGCH